MPPMRCFQQMVGIDKEQVTKLNQTQQSPDNIKEDKPQKVVQKKSRGLNEKGIEVEPQNSFKMEIELGDGIFNMDQINISSWNVNGLRARIMRKGFRDYFDSGKFDIICLNETKIDEQTYVKDKIKSQLSEKYFNYINCSKPPKPGYSGVAIYSKVKPISVRFDLGIPKHDTEGRTLTVEFDKFFLVSCYVPNSGQKLDRLAYRTQQWDTDFKIFLDDLKKIKTTILCGDLNVAHLDIDVHNPKGAEKTSGFTQEERQSFTLFLGDEWIDSFRDLHPNVKKFSALTRARDFNKGWRLDYFVINEKNKDAIISSDINSEAFGSDHLPVEIILDLKKL